MDTTKLETYLIVCKEKSFAKAADKLFITTAAVKKQIDSLENEVGVPLFYRSSAGCSMTEAGVVFQEQAVKILRAVRTAIDRTNEIHRLQVSSLRIGHSVKLRYIFISNLAGEYMDAHNGNLLHFTRLKKADLLSALQNDLIDCFLYINPQKKDFRDIPSALIGTTRVHTIVRHNHPLATQEIITAQDLLPYDIYMSAVLDQSLYDALEAETGTSVHVLDAEEREHLVSYMLRNSVTLYPCPANHSISIPFDYPPMEIRLYYLQKTPAIAEFISFAKNLLSTNQDPLLM